MLDPLKSKRLDVNTTISNISPEKYAAYDPFVATAPIIPTPALVNGKFAPELPPEYKVPLRHGNKYIPVVCENIAKSYPKGSEPAEYAGTVALDT